MVLYFSATGNSRFIAEAIGKYVGDEVVSLNQRMKGKDHTPLHSVKPYILVCPVYAWRMPKVVETYLHTLQLTGNLQCYVLFTCCGGSGNSDGYAKVVMTAMGLTYKGSFKVHMPGSYVAFMENPDM